MEGLGVGVMVYCFVSFPEIFIAGRYLSYLGFHVISMELRVPGIGDTPDTVLEKSVMLFESKLKW